MKLVVESLEELFELNLPGKNPKDILYSKEFNDLPPDEMLLKSVIHGFKEGVLKSLDYNANIHYNQDAALRRAAGGNNKDIVIILLDNGANIHAEHDWALRVAAKKGSVNIVRILLDNSADLHALGDQAMFWANKGQHMDVVKLLNKYKKR